MQLSSIFKTLTALASVVAAADLPAIEISGNKFFYSNNGSQFLLKGVAYQQDVTTTSASSFVDPLADPVACARDIPYLQQLQTNVIRVYALNTSQDHSQCMSLLQQAGIYVIADLSEPELSINRDTPVWNLELYERYTAVVDLFQNYTNVLGFFAGNEVTNNNTNTAASAFVKAAIRDTKSYIKAKGYRLIPVGYSSNDDTTIRVPLADYFTCGSTDERADFFGINNYEWCGSSSYTASGYSTLSNDYANITVPLFFSEYGCNEVSPRTFQEVGTLYGSDMLSQWSGGIVYMYFQEANDYGLVSVSGTSLSTLADFNNLKTQLASVSPSTTSINPSSATAAATVSCPAEYSDWAASTNLPPVPDSNICNCMDQSLTCVVSPSVSQEDYSSLYSYLCGQVSCGGISANGTSGVYGAYSGCDAKEQINFVLNLYYSKYNNCGFSGSATTQKATVASSCSAFISAAGPSGLGAVSGSINTNAGTAVSGGSGSATGSATKSSSGSGTSSGSSTSSAKGNAAIKQYSFDGFSKILMVFSAVCLGSVVIFV